jgi:chromosome segregation ATPase
MSIREVILENFMSYEYARIPFQSGLNIVCGPNGAGKSSILLAISVALGQAYTERGRKLSDLIRRGEESARVTVTFENTLNGGESRPIPKFDADFFRLSRYLKKDGNYWFEANFQTITKSEVESLLAELGINPDNMLIIMHQHMMTEFGETTAQKKLQMVEEAVGFNEYRTKIFTSQTKLNQVLSEEESVANLLQNAEQTLHYWHNEYERYQQRKALLGRKSHLEHELAWAKLIKQEAILTSWTDKLQGKRSDLSQKQAEIDDNHDVTLHLKTELASQHNERNRLYDSHLAFEKEKTTIEDRLTTLQKTLDHVEEFESHLTLSQSASSHDQSPTFTIPSPSESQLDPHALDRRLSEILTQAQLLKHEAGKLDSEHTQLQKLMADKAKKEKALQRYRQRFTELSAIDEQFQPQLEQFDALHVRITREEDQFDSLTRELNHLIERVSPTLVITPRENPIQTAQAIVDTIQSRLASSANLEGQKATLEHTMQTLTTEHQTTLTTIQVLENDLATLTTQRSDTLSCLEGNSGREKIVCEVCGSVLTADQWHSHVSTIEDQIQVTSEKLVQIRDDLQRVQSNSAATKDELSHLQREERLIEAMQPALSQSQQLLQDMHELNTKLTQHRDAQKAILHQLDIEVDDSISAIHRQLTAKAKDLQSEVHTLKLGITQLEHELANFEELHVTPQRERVTKARHASESYTQLLPEISKEIRDYITEITHQIQQVDQKHNDLARLIATAKAGLDGVEERIRSITERYQEATSRANLLAFQVETLNKEINQLRSEVDRAQRELDQLKPIAEASGPRIDTERSPIDVAAEIKLNAAHLEVLKDVSADVEEMYLNYQTLYDDLTTKAALVSENRESTILEVEERKRVWAKVLQALLDQVNPTYQSFLEKINATGLVRLVDIGDIEAAGLNLVVGFKGADLQVLDARTHSGGERSSATMAFLLALQRHVKSPFRAVDEFDIHMDPRNRETISYMLLDEIRQGMGSQYLTITPGQIPNVNEDVHVITVQRVEGKSAVNTTSAVVQSEPVSHDRPIREPLLA